MILILWLLCGAIVWSLFVYDCIKHSDRHFLNGFKLISFVIISILLFAFGPINLAFLIRDMMIDLYLLARRKITRNN